MRKIPALLLMALCCHRVIGADERARTTYPWLENLDRAREVAAEQRKPMLIVFRCVP